MRVTDETSTVEPRTTNGAEDPHERIRSLLDQAARFLPEQTPLHTFVHHNTLHAFEDRPFTRAVVDAARRFGTHPYPTEAYFRRALRTGRIQLADLEAVVEEHVRGNPRSDVPFLDGGPSLREFLTIRLRHLVEIPRGHALEWRLAETDLLDRVHESVDPSRRRVLNAQAARLYAGPPRQRERRLLRELWRNLERVAPHVRRDEPAGGVRRRDQLLAVGGEDTDARVLPLLIRLTAAFLDQGIAYWPMPRRAEGLLVAFRDLYRRPIGPPDRWMIGLAATLQGQHDAGYDAERTILAALDALGVAEAQWAETIERSLHALRGFAGMVRQFEVRPDRAPVEPRPARLIDFLAVQLTLDAFAARHVLADTLGADAHWEDLERVTSPIPTRQDRSLVFEAFVLAQIAPLPIHCLRDVPSARLWMSTIRHFDDMARRALLHAAFERRLHVNVFDGLLAHGKLPAKRAPRPQFQAVFCIDERECSTRRHLEECHPAVETFGYAGFFGVAMAWQGLGEVRPRPLCPVNVTPRHYVTERALSPEEETTYLAARRRRGLATRAVDVGSRTLWRGSLISSLLGLLSVVPLIGRCLFPRLSQRISHWIVDATLEEPATHLVLERADDRRDAEGRLRGYTVPEMADVVAGALRTMGLRQPCDVVLVVGHGSSSLNNPHEAAHDCGATGGGRGGPNARVFAAMANHPGTRRELTARGIHVPDGTWFVGAYHNTCDDSMTYYDEELVPEERMADLGAAKRALQDACQLEAHERCRRFLSAPPGQDPAQALRHVEARAVDLAQPRPEYGHATNAVAIVGRRMRTRGLFLDRRAFLVSYDPTGDSDGTILENLLGAVVPVGAGINLEYYFSFVDPVGYGCGTKLPHNITGLVGVMDGHSSDLRTGLPWQMVEIHEPVRLLAIVEADPEVVLQILARRPEMEHFVRNGWIHLACLHPERNALFRYEHGRFEPYVPESTMIPVVLSSGEFYAGQHDHLGPARVQAAFAEMPASPTEPGGGA